MGLSLEAPTSYMDLVRQYVDNDIATLEYDLHQAGSIANADPEIQEKWIPYRACTELTIQKSLLKLDKQLTEFINDGTVGQFLNSNNVLTNILRQPTVRYEDIVASPNNLFVLIFDGMRWDLWERVIKPELNRHFRQTNPDTNPFLAMLPSITGISRTSLAAGLGPNDWKKTQQGFSITSESTLFSSIYRASNNEVYFQVQNEDHNDIFDELITNKDAKRKFNLFVVNTCDDLIHSQNKNEFEIGEMARGTVRSYLSKLASIIEENDTLVVSTDHGYIRLYPDEMLDYAKPYVESDEKDMKDRNSFRYTTDYNVIEELGLDTRVRIHYDKNTRWDRSFYVTTGHTWLNRHTGGSRPRYAHGGISLAEMVVPGAIFAKDTNAIPTLQWLDQKTEYEYHQDHSPLLITLSWSGNEPISFDISPTDTATITPLVGNIGPRSKTTIEIRPNEQSSAQYNDETISQVRVTGSAKKIDTGEPLIVDQLTLHIKWPTEPYKLNIDQRAFDLFDVYYWREYAVIFWRKHSRSSRPEGRRENTRQGSIKTYHTVE